MTDSRNAVERPVSILVVDDNEGLRETLQGLLQDHGYEVSTAHDGGEALRYLESHQPDVALMDVAMDPMGGLPALEAMQQREVHVPVVLMSGNWLLGDKLPRGCRAFLLKPFLPEALLRILDALVSPAKAGPLATGFPR